jgi:hypothetical protein
MDGGLAAVFAAIVTAIGGIGIALVQMRQLRVENRDDHATVTARLDRVVDIVTDTSTKLSSHLAWHITKPTEEIPRVKLRQRSQGVQKKSTRT